MADTAVAASGAPVGAAEAARPARTPGRWINDTIRRHGYALAALTVVSIVAYGGAVALHPLHLDNLIYFSLGAKPDPWGFFTDSFTTYFPAYRPLGTFTFWVQYQLQELTTAPYFIFNIGVWLACCVVVYALVQRLTGSRLAGCFAGLFLMLDDRASWVVWNLTERQNAFCCLFGLLALLIILGGYGQRHRRLAAAGVFVLLLAAALSKEYGLVFSAAAVVAALTTRGEGWKLVLAASVGAVAAYAALRLGLAAGASQPFCDGMGFFGDRRVVCYDDLDAGARLQQYAYNVGASFIGTFEPSVFDDIGAIAIPGQFGVRGILLPSLVAVAAGAAALRWPRQVAPLLTLVVVNTVLSFVQYRTRNQLVAVVGLYVAGGMGLALALRYARERADWKVVRVVGIGVLVLLVGVQTARTADSIDHIRTQQAQLDPCKSLRDYPKDIDRNVVRAMKERYDLPNPRCE